MKENIIKLINEQINKEFYSSYLYFSYSNFFVEKGLNGFANWYNVQAKEELDHAILMVNYLNDNDAKVTYDAIANPSENWSEIIDILKAGLAHEQYITDSIHQIYGEATKVSDYRTIQFLNWFIKEQSEEETKSTELIKKMELFGQESKGLYMLDQELSARTYVAPTINLQN